MTIRYCDFCGDVIPEGEGDPIAFGDALANPDCAKDACDACTNILWRFTEHKNLKTVNADSLGSPVPPDSGSRRRQQADLPLQTQRPARIQRLTILEFLHEPLH